ncbi:MAG: RHS repeat-associated core domain-containing protein [Firmicutes bacterium]|nr:RHS repeat-associated core domain-containing protein [Bacillota bacterium]
MTQKLKTNILIPFLAVFLALICLFVFNAQDWQRVSAEQYERTVSAESQVDENEDYFVLIFMLAIFVKYDESGISGFNMGGWDYIFQKNILGDIVSIWRADGAFGGSYQYDAWGNTTILADPLGVANWNPFRYRGYYQDQESGFYYLNSRYYDPEIGRFINADDPVVLFLTAGMCGGANLYAYCGNNPVMRVDYSGYSWLSNLFSGISSLLSNAAVALESVMEMLAPHVYEIEFSGTRGWLRVLHHTVGVALSVTVIARGIVLMLAPEPTSLTIGVGFTMTMGGLATFVLSFVNTINSLYGMVTRGSFKELSIFYIFGLPR